MTSTSPATSDSEESKGTTPGRCAGPPQAGPAECAIIVEGPAPSVGSAVREATRAGASDSEGRRGTTSLRRYLLLGILLPIGLFILIDTFSLYRQALAAVNTAYDRTLLASAKSIGEHISAEGDSAVARLRANVPYSALEAFEADNRSRMVYRISNLDGELVDGFDGLRAWRGRLPDRGLYAALVDFYDDIYQGDPVRVAVLLQPVAMQQARAMAVVQVAETLDLRRTLARQILIDTLWRQAALVSIIAVVVVWVVQRATRPVRRLSQQLQARPDDDLTALKAPDAPLELIPLIEATNSLMARLQHLLDHQKRFVRDASHQLRTPLAVLRVQVQSALRGDVAPQQALQEIGDTVQRATRLANQMLSLAKVAQLAQQAPTGCVDWAQVVREVALDISPLIAEKDLDFEIATEPALIRTEDWMLRELSRNLLHNAITHTPAQRSVTVRLESDGTVATLTVSDSGPGISEVLRTRLFQPFSSGTPGSGSGLGLVICQEIVHTLGGGIRLDNRQQAGQVAGLDSRAHLPLAKVIN